MDSGWTGAATLRELASNGSLLAQREVSPPVIQVFEYQFPLPIFCLKAWEHRLQFSISRCRTPGRTDVEVVTGLVINGEVREFG